MAVADAQVPAITIVGLVDRDIVDERAKQNIQKSGLPWVKR